MRKALLKRFKITKTGKLLHRRPGHNHFNAKARRKTQLHRKTFTTLPVAIEKKARQELFA